MPIEVGIIGLFQMNRMRKKILISQGGLPSKYYPITNDIRHRYLDGPGCSSQLGIELNGYRLLRGRPRYTTCYLIISSSLSPTMFQVENDPEALVERALKTTPFDCELQLQQQQTEHEEEVGRRKRSPKWNRRYKQQQQQQPLHDEWGGSTGNNESTCR